MKPITWHMGETMYAIGFVKCSFREGERDSYLSHSLPISDEGRSDGEFDDTSAEDL